MTKKEFTESIAKKAGLTNKQAAAAVDAFVNVVADTLSANEKITIPGFGTYEMRKRAARTSRNPRNGEPIQVPETTVPAFKFGTSFKKRV